jgi:hypothetical protein
MGQQTIFGQFGTFSGFSSVGPSPPFLADSAANGGVGAWTIPGSLPGSATAVMNNNKTHWLVSTYSGFKVPANATIVGVQAALAIGASVGNVQFDATTGAVLVRAGTPQPASTPRTFVPANFQGPGVLSTFLLGGPSDTWGLALTPADVNSFGNFGVAFSFFGSGAFSVSVSVPISLTVYYTLPTSSGVVLRDSSSNPLQSQWTNGATIIAPVGAQPGLTTPWDVIGWGVSFLGQHTSPNPNGGGYGRLGELWGGLVLSNPTPTLGPIPWVSPMLPFPGNLATFVKIWDGANDAPFPRADGSTAVAGVPYVPKFTELTYPVPLPVTMQPGDQLAIGLWLTPGLLLNTLTQVAGATWSISYDDGLT